MAGMAVGVTVGVPGMGETVGVSVRLGVITNGTDVQVGAFVRVGMGDTEGVGVQVAG